MSDTQQLEKALVDAGHSRLIEYWGTGKTAFLTNIQKGLNSFVDEYAKRYADRPNPFLLLEENPIKGRAFFQFDTLSASVEMKIMVWRILLGYDVIKVDFHYDQNQEPVLSIQLRNPYAVGQDEEYEEYRAKHWADFRVLRHLGTVKSDGRLRFEGYYAAASASR